MDLTNLNELYAYLEKDFRSLKREWELTTDIRKIVEQTNDEEAKNKLKWECFAFDFFIQDGQVKPMGSTTREDGTTVYAYPSFQDFGEEGLIYLKQRSQEVKNDFLISRYNHILWNSPKPHKHRDNARNAVDAYLRILSQLDCIEEEKKSGRDCLAILKNGFKIAIQSKYRAEDFKKILKGWLFEKGKFQNEMKILLLKYMLDNPLFKKEDFTGTLDLVYKIGTARRKTISDYHFAKEMYSTGLRIATKVGSDPKIWNKRIGDAIAKMAEYRMDDETRMVPLSMLKDAIPYYKLAGLPKKVREIEYRYSELKKELKLSKFPVSLNDGEVDALEAHLAATVRDLMQLNSEQIFDYLLTGENIFPKKKWLSAMAKNQNYLFMDLATTVRFDINNNLSKDSGDKELKQKTRIYETYDLYMRLYILPLLHRIFVEGIKCGKVNFPDLAKFFVDGTWLGQEQTDFNSAGELVKYNWISLIGPSLHEYFVQTESALKSNNPFTNYVMPIDSLTLKFEGVIRDFARLLNISTTVAGKNNVLREKYIEEILAEKEIQKYFNEDDVLFFNYLFVAKNGMNLRNNIAHCFYRYNNYSFQIMHLLICAFLRIGKYRITVEKSNQ